jgi:hypothetical protein
MSRAANIRPTLQGSARAIASIAGAGLLMLIAVDQASAQFSHFGPNVPESWKAAPLPRNQPPVTGSHGIGGGGGGGGGSNIIWRSNAVSQRAWLNRATMPVRPR